MANYRSYITYTTSSCDTCPLMYVVYFPNTIWTRQLLPYSMQIIIKNNFIFNRKFGVNKKNQLRVTKKYSIVFIGKKNRNYYY